MNRWKIALGASVLVVAAAGGSLAAVNLSGGSQPEQVRLIAPSGATVSTSTVPAPSTTVAPTTTVPQAPATTVPATTTTVARVIVPDVAGDTFVYAQTVLSQAGLTYTTVKTGYLVVGQEPIAGTSVPVGFAITLTLGTH